MHPINVFFPSGYPHTLNQLGIPVSVFDGFEDLIECLKVLGSVKRKLCIRLLGNRYRNRNEIDDKKPEQS
jgi:hypothetical protein